MGDVGGEPRAVISRRALLAGSLATLTAAGVSRDVATPRSAAAHFIAGVVTDRHPNNVLTLTTRSGVVDVQLTEATDFGATGGWTTADAIAVGEELGIEVTSSSSATEAVRVLPVFRTFSGTLSSFGDDSLSLSEHPNLKIIKQGLPVRSDGASLDVGKKLKVEGRYNSASGVLIPARITTVS